MPNRVDLPYRVEVAPSRRHHSVEEIKAHLENPDNVTWIPAEFLLGDWYNSCVDGREQGMIVGMPGGGVAFLTEVIVAFGSELGKRLDRVEINEVFLWHLRTFGSFYMHTDGDALLNLGRSLLKDERFAKRLQFDEVNISSDRVLEYLRKPDADRQVALLDHLVKPENIGCGHLSAMLKSSQVYAMSRKVIDGLMGAFFNTMWNGDSDDQRRLVYRVLKGEHQEGAVTQVYVGAMDMEIGNDTMIPMIRPSNGEVSMFVVHPQVIKWLQRWVAVALAESGLFSDVPKDEIERLYGRMGELSESATRLTVGSLALDLPKFVLVMTPEGELALDRG